MALLRMSRCLTDTVHLSTLCFRSKFHTLQANLAAQVSLVAINAVPSEPIKCAHEVVSLVSDHAEVQHVTVLGMVPMPKEREGSLHHFSLNHNGNTVPPETNGNGVAAGMQSSLNQVSHSCLVHNA
jgi:hypothetical protein